MKKLVAGCFLFAVCALLVCACYLEGNINALRPKKGGASEPPDTTDPLDLPYTGEPGSGVNGDPFIVHNVATLQKVGTGEDGWTLGACYLQVRNIDMSDTGNWEPIGDDEFFFTGSYDGGGRKILNLRISENYNASLFNTIDGGTVRDLNLVNCNVKSANSRAGGIAAYIINGSVVEKCIVSGEVSGNDQTGGIVGQIEDSAVKDCSFDGNVDGKGSDLGGIVGWSRFSSQVVNCSSTGKVTGNESSCDRAGGVVGQNSAGTVENSYSASNVSGKDNIGGVVGYNSGTVKSCYSTGDVKGSSNVGGVVGYNSGTVENCYSTSGVSGGGSGLRFGGVAGLNYNSGTLRYCYSTGSVSGGSLVGGITGQNANTTQNCVALGSNVTVTMNSTSIGRIVGTGTGEKIYARDDMTLIGSASPDGTDGESIIQAEWEALSWWLESTGDTAPWDFTYVWQWNNNKLPTLRNVGGAQNPQVN